MPFLRPRACGGGQSNRVRPALAITLEARDVASRRLWQRGAGRTSLRAHAGVSVGHGNPARGRAGPGAGAVADHEWIALLNTSIQSCPRIVTRPGI